MTHGQIERTFTFAAGVAPKITVRNPSGTVDMRGEAREDVAVVVTCDPPDALERGLTVVIEQRDDTVFVETRWPGLTGGLPSVKARVAMDIRTPRMSGVNADLASGEATVAGIEGGVRLSTASGDVRVNDVHGVVQVNSTSGEVRLSDVHGTVHVRTASGDLSIKRGTGEFSLGSASGDVRLDSVTGALHVNTASGDVTANGCAFTQIQMKTASGDAELATALDAHGDYGFQTKSGDVKLLVPEGTALTLTYSTLSGEITTVLPAQRDGDKRKGRLIVNGGGVPVQMGSMSGDYLIQVVHGALPPLPAAATTVAEPPVSAIMPAPLALPEETEPTEPTEQSETLRVLQAVERGELSIDEAMSRLNATDA